MLITILACICIWIRMYEKSNRSITSVCMKTYVFFLLNVSISCLVH